MLRLPSRFAFSDPSIFPSSSVLNTFSLLCMVYYTEVKKFQKGPFKPFPNLIEFHPVSMPSILIKPTLGSRAMGCIINYYMHVYMYIETYKN